MGMGSGWALDLGALSEDRRGRGGVAWESTLTSPLFPQIPKW